jgi:hypothetical protein
MTPTPPAPQAPAFKKPKITFRDVIHVVAAFLLAVGGALAVTPASGGSVALIGAITAGGIAVVRLIIPGYTLHDVEQLAQLLHITWLSNALSDVVKAHVAAARQPPASTEPPL